MTYDEAIETRVTAEQARAEIAKHDADTVCEYGVCLLPDGKHATAWGAFICDHGNCETYRGRDVLRWLGY